MKHVLPGGVLFAILTVLSLLLIDTRIAAAVDELYLTGVVKNVDAAKKIADVDVLSRTCRGQRQFSVDDPQEVMIFLGAKINFMIDSSSCEGDRIHKMLLNERKWK